MTNGHPPMIIHNTMEVRMYVVVFFCSQKNVVVNF
jgi:hypothetical protein